MSDRRRRKWSFANCCSGGCVSVFVVAALFFAIAYSVTGHYRITIPPPKPLPLRNGFTDYVAAGQLLAAAGSTGAIYATPGQPSLKAERMVVSANGPALARMRLALRLECRVPPARGLRGLAAPMPFLASFRDLARLKSAEADVKMAGGDYGGAFDAGLDTIQMGQDVIRGGVFIHGLVGVAVQAIAGAQMVRDVDRLPAKDCDLLVQRMQSLLRTRVPVEDVLMEERNTSLSAMLEMRDMSAFFGATSGAGPGPMTGQVPFWSEVGWHFMRDRTLHEMEQYYRTAISEVVKPRPARKPIPEPTSTFSSSLAPVLSGAAARFDRIDASNRLLLCMAAIRGFRLKHGRLPNGLQELGLDSGLIIDPYSGKPLVYRPQGSDYLLYSVGPDAKDDGGVLADESGERPSGDISVRYLRIPRPGDRGTSIVHRMPHAKLPPLPKGQTVVD